jgi:hypothetical protein
MFFIWPHVISTFFQKVTLICGKMSNLLQELQAWPARDYQVSSHKDIFATCYSFCGTSYIVDLCNKETAGSSFLKSGGVDYDQIAVWLNNVGITAIEFLSSESKPSARPKDEWGYRVAALDGPIYVKSKV